MYEGRDILVSEPYGLPPDARASLAQFCEMFDLKFEVQERPYEVQPGPYMVRIIISRR